MEVRERTLRTEMHYLERDMRYLEDEIRRRRMVHGDGKGDFTPKSDRLRLRLEERKEELRRLIQERQVLGEEMEKVVLCEELAEALFE